MPLTPPPSLERETLEHVVSTDGTPIAVWRSGDGPPLVLVHGATADHSRWAPVLPALQERFTVLAFDRRGRSGDAATYTLERQFNDVAAVVAWAGGPVDVLAHSYGHTVREFAAQAGYARVDVLAVENDFFRVYRLHP